MLTLLSHSWHLIGHMALALRSRPVGPGSSEHLLELLGHGVPSSSRRLPGDRFSVPRLAKGLLDRPRERFWRSLHKHAELGTINNFGNPTNSGGDHWSTTGERLRHYVGPTFAGASETAQSSRTEP